MLPALMRPHDRRPAEAREKREPHVRERGLRVEAGLLLHDGGNLVVDDLLLGRDGELRLDERIMLDELCRREPHGKPRLLRERLYKMRHRVDAAVHGRHGIGRILAVRAEIDARRLLVVARHMQRVLDELVDALVLRRGDRHDRDTERLL